MLESLKHVLSMNKWELAHLVWRAKRDPGLVSCYLPLVGLWLRGYQRTERRHFSETLQFTKSKSDLRSPSLLDDVQKGPREQVTRGGPGQRKDAFYFFSENFIDALVFSHSSLRRPPEPLFSREIVNSSTGFGSVPTCILRRPSSSFSYSGL